ncbi:hypothetical protein KW790_03155 [Candidatus Parcubacteria bacterium]|nr:hypothetical protein [Candidatus Parcubacteria bacterium]
MNWIRVLVMGVGVVVSFAALVQDDRGECRSSRALQGSGTSLLFTGYFLFYFVPPLSGWKVIMVGVALAAASYYLAPRILQWFDKRGANKRRKTLKLE